MTPTLFSSSLLQHMGLGSKVMMSNTLLNKEKFPETLWDTHAPIHSKAICCIIASNLFKLEKDSVAEITVSALFLALHTPPGFATIQLNFGSIARSPWIL